jgi:hypothetical protein
MLDAFNLCNSEHWSFHLETPDIWPCRKHDIGKIHDKQLALHIARFLFAGCGTQVSPELPVKISERMFSGWRGAKKGSEPLGAPPG